MLVIRQVQERLIVNINKFNEVVIVLDCVKSVSMCILMMMSPPGHITSTKNNIDN